MAQSLLELLRGYVAQYGYWAVGITLLLENAGIPVPGETVLLLASFLAYSQHELSLPWVMVVAICSASVGDNLGFWIGNRGGRPFLDRYRSTFRIAPEIVERGESLFARYGAATVFFARFLFGLRIIAGPLAGVLRMPWKRFVIWNVLGATVWVTVISTIGYKFGQHWDKVMALLERLNLAAGVVAVCVVVGVWLWRRRSAGNRKNGGAPRSP
jgi:membrane protein DedA with SNARE-associated domain